MATRSAHTFENRFNGGDEVKDEDLIEPSGFIPDPTRADQLWTLTDPMIESGQQYWVPGWHLVNRVAYFYSKSPHKPEDRSDEFRRW
jgi:hypothetical protein